MFRETVCLPWLLELMENLQTRSANVVSLTDVPTGPLPSGAQLPIYGITLNDVLLINVPPGVVTVTKPLVAPLGTVAVK